MAGSGGDVDEFGSGPSGHARRPVARPASAPLEGCLPEGRRAIHAVWAMSRSRDDWRIAAMSTAFSDWGRLPSASTGVEPERAQALAETLHRGQRDPGGALLLGHIRRVVTAVSRTARIVAWLHELFECTTISEEA